MHGTNIDLFACYPGPFEKIKVRLAAQVFSTSVAAGMFAALNCGILPQTLKKTIYFIYDMDKLFDIFNSSGTPNSKIINDPFKNTLTQSDHLIKMTKVFNNIKVMHKFNKSDVTRCVNFGWLVSKFWFTNSVEFFKF
jgi:hypothetical protein